MRVALVLVRAVLISISIAVLAAMTTTSAVAAPTMTELKKDGYSCKRAGVNFLECTKDGKTYWCTDAGVCELAPARAGNTGGMRAPTEGVLDPGPRPTRRPPAGQALPSAPAIR